MGLSWNHLCGSFTAFRLKWFEDGDEPAEVQAIRVATEMSFSGKHPQWSHEELISKSVLMDKGFEFAGHTGYLGHL